MEAEPGRKAELEPSPFGLSTSMSIVAAQLAFLWPLLTVQSTPSLTGADFRAK